MQSQVETQNTEAYAHYIFIELGVIYIAITGDKEYPIVKIRNEKNEIVIKLKEKELREDKRPIISVG